MRRLRPLVASAAATVAAFALIVAPSLAHADPARDNSRIEFSRGVGLVHQGDYPGARDAFAEAYRLYPHPSILLNLGIAQWKTGQYVEAESSLVKFLADYGDASAENVESARAALRELRTHLGSVRLVVTTPDAHVTFDSRSIPVTANVEVAIAGVVGDHELTVQATGFVSRHEKVHLEAGSVKPLSVTLEAGADAPEAGSAGGGGTNDKAVANGASESGGNGNTRAVVGWSLLGAGAAAAIVGTVCGVRAISLANDYNHHGFDPDDRSSGTTFRTLADVTFVTAIVAGGIGAYLVLVKPDANNANGAGGTSTALGLGPGSFSLRQTF
jgi:hypothetical protein